MSVAPTKASESQLLSFIACLICLGLSLAPYLFQAPADSDLWWHLKTGSQILEDGKLLRVDSYSFASGAVQWLNHEWFAQVLLAKLYLHLGNDGLTLLRSLQLALIAGLLVFIGNLLWGRLGFCTAIVSCLLLPIINFYLNLRPRGFTFIFLLLIALVPVLYKRGKRKALWLYPPLLVFFCNIHGAFLFGLGLCLLALISLFLFGDGAKISHESSDKRRIIIVGLLSVLAVFVNPYGIELVIFSIQELGTEHPHITEWQALTPEQLPPFFFLIILALGGFLLPPRRFDQPFLLVFAAITGYLAYQHNRFFILFLFAATLLFFSQAEKIWSFFKGDSSGKIVRFLEGNLFVLLLSTFLLPPVYTGVSKSLSQPSSLMIDARRYPIQAVEFLKQRKLGSKLGIQFDWGGYALWHLYPDYLVSIDGRYASVYGSEYADQQIRSYLAGDLSSFIGEKGMDVILVDNSSRLFESLSKSADWAQIFRDPLSSIFVQAKQGGLSLTEHKSLPQIVSFP